MRPFNEHASIDKEELDNRTRPQERQPTTAGIRDINRAGARALATAGGAAQAPA